MSYFTKKFRLFPTILFMALSMSLPNNHILSQERVPAENIEQFVDIFSRIKEQYVDEVDDQKLFNLAIKGMVSGLDPHSSFLSSDDFNEVKIGTTGKFGGLGIEIPTEEGFV